MVIDFEKHIAYLLGKKDALITEFIIDPQEVLTWLTPDPKASKYPHQSPYAYCSNNPVMKVDPDGMEDDWISKDPPHNKEENYIRQSSQYNTKNTQQQSATDLSSRQINHGISIDVTLAAGPLGINAEIGVINDSRGNANLYLSYGQAVGGEISIGVNALYIPQNNFNINNFEGQGIGINVNMGPVSLGSFTDQSKGAIRDSYNNNYLGFKLGLGYGSGLSINPNSKTTLLNSDGFQNIGNFNTSNSVYYKIGHK
jgi:hypothetical protein